MAMTKTYASEQGRSGFSGNPAINGGVDCTACHTTGAARPSVSIFGPNDMNAGQTYQFSVVISGGPAVTAGVAISIGDSSGDLRSVDSRLRRFGSELSHSQPQRLSGGAITFNFQWTAPNYNTNTTMYVGANSTNGRLDLLGDGIATATHSLRVTNGTVSPPVDPPVEPAQIKLERYTEGLQQPVSIANAGDGRLFVLERAGRIRIVDPGGSLRTEPFLDITSRVDSSAGEMGLLGLAFHPRYATNNYFYVYYTYDPGNGAAKRTRISRFERSGNPNIGRPQSELVMLEFEQPYPNHNAGDMHFNTDGFLYIASGDGGSGGDPQNFAQNPTSLLGKILRINVNTETGAGNPPDCNLISGNNYRVPVSNAFNDGPGNGCGEIYASGLRNPWRFSFDSLTGDLWIGDVGQNNIEEVNHVAFGGAAGMNFGWRCKEGSSDFKPQGCSGTFFKPVHERNHSTGDCSVTGGYVYRGSSIPSLVGKYVFSDYCNPSIRTLTRSGSAWQANVVLTTGGLGTPTAFGQDNNGELYVASLTQGRIYRITQNSAPAPTPTLTILSRRYNEGAANATVPVTLNTATSREVSVTLFTRSGTATTGQDFYGFSQVVTFAPGEVRKNIPITIRSDNRIEGDEQFTLHLVRPTNGRLSGSGVTTSTIVDGTNGSLPVLSINNVTVNETTQPFSIPARLSAAASTPVTGRIFTRIVTARGGQDYYGFTQSFTIPAGQTTAFIPVTVLNDNVSESTETFKLITIDLVGARLATPQATVTIIDDD